MLNVLNIEHRQTVYGGGLGAHPIVVNHEGSLSGKRRIHTRVKLPYPALV